MILNLSQKQDLILELVQNQELDPFPPRTDAGFHPQPGIRKDILEITFDNIFRNEDFLKKS